MLFHSQAVMKILSYIRKSLALLLLFIPLTIACVSDSGDSVPSQNNLLLSDRFLNIAHRGGGLLAPEETIVAFQNAIDIGTDVLEMDVHATVDGVIVLCHDATIDRTTNGTGMIKEITFKELQGFDAGYRYTPDGGATYPYRGQGLIIPALEEILTAFPDWYFSIEIKQHDPSIVDDVLRILAETGIEEQVVIASAFDDVLMEIHGKNPNLITSFGANEIWTFSNLEPEDEAKYFLPGEILQVPVSQGTLEIVTPDLITRANRFNLKVHVWTINDPVEMQRLIDMGVDGIITDDPATLETIIIERGLDG